MRNQHRASLGCGWVTGPIDQCHARASYRYTSQLVQACILDIEGEQRRHRRHNRVTQTFGPSVALPIAASGEHQSVGVQGRGIFDRKREPP